MYCINTYISTYGINSRLSNLEKTTILFQIVYVYVLECQEVWVFLQLFDPTSWRKKSLGVFVC